MTTKSAGSKTELPVFDPNAPHGIIAGHPHARFDQNGCMFTVNHEPCTDKGIIPVPKQRRKPAPKVAATVFADAPGGEPPDIRALNISALDDRAIELLLKQFNLQFTNRAAAVELLESRQQTQINTLS